MDQLWIYFIFTIDLLWIYTHTRALRSPASHTNLFNFIHLFTSFCTSFLLFKPILILSSRRATQSSMTPNKTPLVTSQLPIPQISRHPTRSYSFRFTSLMTHPSSYDLLHHSSSTIFSLLHSSSTIISLLFMYQSSVFSLLFMYQSSVLSLLFTYHFSSSLAITVHPFHSSFSIFILCTLFPYLNYVLFISFSWLPFHSPYH